jgi:hypothetical protein
MCFIFVDWAGFCLFLWLHFQIATVNRSDELTFNAAWKSIPDHGLATLWLEIRLCISDSE